MSAATGSSVDFSSDGSSVRQWVREVRTHQLDPVPAAGGPDIATVCAAAVDPLEIAAALEAAGMSHHVVAEEHGHPDVFSLAHELWSTVPFRDAGAEAPAAWRRGNMGDLGRGALYAAPALLIHSVTEVSDVRLPWWTLPLAMTWGWAMGQLVAFGGYTMRGRGDARGERRLVALAFVLAIVTTVGLARLAELLLGGGAAAVAGATVVTTYMVSSAVLLLHEEERLGALLLMPGAVLGALALIWPGALPPMSVVAAIGGSAAATLLAAIRHLGLPLVARSAITTRDALRALEHWFHGLLCGSALSVIVILGVERFDLSTHAAALTAPLLVTLGLMEWRLRSFRADVESLSRSLTTLEGFGTRAVRLFARGFGLYVAGVVATATAVAVLLQHNAEAVTAVLTAQVALGALYYVDLTLTSLGRLDVVLRHWSIGLAGGAVFFGIASVLHGEPATWGWWSAHVAVWIAVLTSLPSAAAVVATPCSH